MGPRKRLPKEEAVKTFNDSIDRYIHPPNFRDRNVNITIYSSLLQLAEVRDCLSVDEQAIFRGTAIGHLLSVPADSKFSGTILHFLLSREIHMDNKPNEMHFKVGGKILHFGKREFALVTGLSFKKPEKDFVSPPKSSSLMWTHFPNQYRVTGLEVKALLFKKNSTCPSLDRVKFALLLVVHRFLMGCPDRDAINISYWHLVDDLEEFNKYPWGEVTFGRFTKFRSAVLYQANKENNGAGGETKYKVIGIAHALVVWALDIMPGLFNLCGRKIESIGWLPHMLCVLCTQSPKYPCLRTLEMNDVHVRSGIMWQKGDANQLIMLGLEEGTPEIEDELSSFIRTEKERHEYHVVDSFLEREDDNQGHELPEMAPVSLSKKRKRIDSSNRMAPRKRLRKKVSVDRLQLMDRRKSLRKKVVVEGAKDIDRYIHPPEFRDKYVHVANISSLMLLAEVRKWLSVDEQAIFKSTAIGHLLSVPEDSKFSGTIVHFLLSREIHMDDKPDEMHFKVGGKLLHFGKREFALVTGLSFKKPEKAFVYSANPPSLMRTHFPNHNFVSASKVKALLFKKNSTCPSLDRVKFALLLVVHNFLMGREDRDGINIDYWHLVEDLDEFNKYPWGEVTFDGITKFKVPLLYQANKRNSGAGGTPAYKVVGIPHALWVWALDVMPGLLNLCGRKIETEGWQPHMLCVSCTKSPPYPHIIQELEVNDVNVHSDIMWQKGDANQLIVLGLEDGTSKSTFNRTGKERHEYRGGSSSLRDSFHVREDSSQGHEVSETAPVFLSKKRKISTEKYHPYEGKGIGNYEPEHFPSSEPMTLPAISLLHTSVKHSHDKDAPIVNMSSCSGAETRGIESPEVGVLGEESADATMNTSSSKVLTTDSTLLNILASIDVFPSPPGFASASSQVRVEGFEYVDNFMISEEHAVLYKKIYEKHGHMATKKVIKFNDAMLLACVTSLLKIIPAMENVRGSELSEALLGRWEGFIKDAEVLEFNIKWLREGFSRLRNHWRSSLRIDKEVESHVQVLNEMQDKYDCLSTREDQLDAELLEVKIQKRKVEAAISSERKAMQERLTEKIKFQNECVVGLVLG